MATVALLSEEGIGLLQIDDFAHCTTEYLVFYWLGLAALAVTPLLFLFCAALSPKVGVPAFVGMVRGVRGLAMPVACLLVLLTVPLFVWQAREDAVLNHALDRLEHEGNRYLADISNKPWPLHAAPKETLTP